MRYIIACGLILLGVFAIAISEDAPMPASTAENTAPTTTYSPGREPIQFPMNYREELVHYATVDRIDGISRNIYISPQAVIALRKDERIPDRSVVLIEAYATDERDEMGRLQQTERDPEIHMAESRSTWQIADLAATSRVGDWNFGAFDARDGSVMTETGLNDCFSCHEAASNRNFLFSNRLLEAFVETGTVQYRYCRRIDRRPCS